MTTESHPEATVEQVSAEVERRLRRLAHAWREHGRDLRELGDAAAMADRMVAALPAPAPWNELVGPFFRTSQVAGMLGVSRQAVDERRRRGTLLGCRTRDEHWVFPAFQFRGRTTRPELVALLRAFDSPTVDGWTLAAWLTAPHEHLENSSPLEHVSRLGGMDDRLSLLAADQQARWSA